MGKMYSFCAMYSFEDVSAWMVPESLFRVEPALLPPAPRYMGEQDPGRWD